MREIISVQKATELHSTDQATPTRDQLLVKLLTHHLQTKKTFSHNSWFRSDAMLKVSPGLTPLDCDLMGYSVQFDAPVGRDPGDNVA